MTTTMSPTAEDAEATAEVATVTKKIEDDPEEEKSKEVVILSAPMTTTMSPMIVEDMSSSPAASVLQLMEEGTTALGDVDDEIDTNMADGIGDGTDTSGDKDEVAVADDSLAVNLDVIDDVAEKEGEADSGETTSEVADVETTLSSESKLKEEAPLDVALTIKETTVIKAIEDPMPVEVAVEVAAIEELASSDKDQ